MSLYLYSHDTTPATAARISADRGEVVHVHCPDAATAHDYSVALRSILAGSNTTGDLPAELETFGDLDGAPVRVHCAT